jgi:hypothetical protein
MPRSESPRDPHPYRKTQIGLHRCRRPTQPWVEEPHERREERRIIQQSVHPGQLLGQPEQLLREHRLEQRRLIAYRTKHDGLDPFSPRG